MWTKPWRRIPGDKNTGQQNSGGQNPGGQNPGGQNPCLIYYIVFVTCLLFCYFFQGPIVHFDMSRKRKKTSYLNTKFSDNVVANKWIVLCKSVNGNVCHNQGTFSKPPCRL